MPSSSLNVPHFQQELDYSCVAACVRMGKGKWGHSRFMAKILKVPFFRTNMNIACSRGLSVRCGLAGWRGGGIRWQLVARSSGLPWRFTIGRHTLCLVPSPVV